MPDHRYLSIGEVLGLLLEDFPDVTISKIRFLESQGLIEPERTPSGYRKFYDDDVELLRAILHEQRENFLPLKVIRDRIESGGIQADNTGARTPPRGIRNVGTAGTATITNNASTITAARPAPTTVVSAEALPANERDSVFRRTDGGPEWADGQALNPGHQAIASPVTAAVPVIPAVPVVPVGLVTPSSYEREATSVSPGVARPAVVGAPIVTASIVSAAIMAEAIVSAPVEISAVEISAVQIEPAEIAPAEIAPLAIEPADVGPSDAEQASSRPSRGAGDSGLPYDRDELCTAAGITTEQLADLESYGLVVGRGTGRDVTYAADALPIATVAARFLANGIDARHLRTWRQAADREAALFEQRIMPLLRQRNPQSRQAALSTLTELADLGGQLRTALLDSVLRHHFEGS